MSAEGSLSIGNAWNGVALEERLELISRSKAVGLTSAIGFTLLMGSIAYGFDQIWLLLVGMLGSFLIAPLFSSYTWRQGKPELILSYLAVRSMARRFALGMNVSELDIILIFRGTLQKRLSEEERLELMEAGKDLADSENPIPVWLCLMRGGVIALSEQRGGAKMEFFTPLTAEATCTRGTEEDQATEDDLVLTGAGIARGKKAVISSNYKAAFYVFEKQAQALIEEALSHVRYLENLRTKTPV